MGRELRAGPAFCGGRRAPPPLADAARPLAMLHVGKRLCPAGIAVLRPSRAQLARQVGSRPQVFDLPPAGRRGVCSPSPWARAGSPLLCPVRTAEVTPCGFGGRAARAERPRLLGPLPPETRCCWRRYEICDSLVSQRWGYDSSIEIIKDASSVGAAHMSPFSPASCLRGRDSNTNFPTCDCGH